MCLIPSGSLNSRVAVRSSSSVSKPGLALQLSEERLSTQSSLWEKVLPKLCFRRAVCNSFPFRCVIKKLSSGAIGPFPLYSSYSGMQLLIMEYGFSAGTACDE